MTEPGGVEDILDLTKGEEDSTFGAGESVRVATKTEAIAEAQEKVRGLLALGLIGAVVLVTFFFALSAAAGWLDVEDVKSLTALILTPLVGLAGSAAGFYFGQKG